MEEKEELRERKRHFIPLVACGKMSAVDAGKEIGITRQSVHRLVRRYKISGDETFIHALKGKRGTHCRFTVEQEKEILKKYEKCGSGEVASFLHIVNDWEKMFDKPVSVNVMRRLLKRNGIPLPVTYRRRKTHKKSRPSRENAGELVQFDATPFQWFKFAGDEKYYALHGNIDDASHKIGGLYMCKNECRLGYSEVLRQTFSRFGIPSSTYTDMSTCFFSNVRWKDRTLEEKLDEMKSSKTWFTDLCKTLEIKNIIALSAQAKGKVERMWRTLQTQLPQLFRLYDIDNMEKANSFLQEYIEWFNHKYERQCNGNAYKSLAPDSDLDYLLCVKIPKRTKKFGLFTFQGEDFVLKCDCPSYRDFELCISERFGLKAKIKDKYYDIALNSPIVDVIGDPMPKVTKDLISRYLCVDSRAFIA